MDFSMESYIDKSLNAFSKGKIHGGFLTILRMHKWIDEANMCYYYKDIFNRAKCWILIYNEVRTKLSPKEKGEFDILRNEIEEEITDIEKNKTTKIISTKLPSMLRKFEDVTRDYADKHDMLNPTRESVYDVMGEED